MTHIDSIPPSSPSLPGVGELHTAKVPEDRGGKGRVSGSQLSSTVEGMPTPLFNRSVAEELLEKRWAMPTYTERLQSLIRSRVQGAGVVQPIRLERTLENGTVEMREDDFANLIGELGRDVGANIYDQLKTFRNIFGAPFAIHEAWVKGGEAQKKAGKISGLFDEYRQLAQSIHRTVALANMLMELGELRDAATDTYKAGDVKKALEDLLKDEKKVSSQLRVDGKAAMKALQEIAKQDSESSVAGAAVEGLIETLIKDFQAIRGTQKKALCEAFIDIKLVEAGIALPGSQGERADIESQYPSVFEKEVHKHLASRALNTHTARHFAGKLAWAGALLLIESVKLVSVFFKILSVFRIPGTFATAKALGALCDVLRAGLYGESFTIDAQKAYKSYGIAKETGEYLSELEKVGKMPKASVSSIVQDLGIQKFELKALAKGIKRQQDLISGALATVSTGIMLGGVVISIGFIVLKVLAFAGLIAGGVVAFASPIGGVFFVAGLTVSLGYGIYSMARWVHNKYNESSWNACLREVNEKGKPNDKAEVAKRSALYQKLYAKAETLNLSGADAHEYVHRRALSRVLQHDKVLLVDTLYERLRDSDDTEVRSLLSRLKVMDPAMMQNVARADEAQKELVIDHLNKALGFAI